MQTILTGARIFDGTQFLDDHCVVIKSGRIESILPANAISLNQQDTHIKLDGGTLAPGFIDLQVNGGGGILFNNAPNSETAITMINAHRTKGVCGIFPTLISDSTETIDAGVNAIRSLITAKFPGILGVHIEGPFFNMSRRGVHNEQYIRKISQQDMEWLISLADIPTLLTLAPECTKQGQIRELTNAGMIVCAGHTDAHAHEVKSAIQEGLIGFTHLFNAMRPMTSREPGVVGAALADENSYCGIIVDNHHVHPTSVLVAHQAKSRGKLYLVSDAMATVGSPHKEFELYGETIAEKDGCLVNSEGKLAGSAIGLIDAVKLTHQSVGLSLEECLRMASLYPARFIQQDHLRGHIKIGYQADMVHFNDDFNVLNTWISGSHQSHQKDI